VGLVTDYGQSNAVRPRKFRQTGDFVTVLLPAPLLQALDRYLVEEAPNTNRSEAVSDAFRECCAAKGYMEGHEAERD
jgi:metal-responsive CopG/Arc/MetJ family transcriptional regulator